MSEEEEKHEVYVETFEEYLDDGSVEIKVQISIWGPDSEEPISTEITTVKHLTPPPKYNVQIYLRDYS